MQEEVENRTVNLAISTTKLTGRTIIAGIRKYLQHREKVKIASASVAVSESPKRVLMSGWIIKCKICQGRRTTRRQTSKHIESSIKCSHDKKHMATFFT